MQSMEATFSALARPFSLKDFSGCLTKLKTKTRRAGQQKIKVLKE
jgi:hypothetical protein